MIKYFTIVKLDFRKYLRSFRIKRKVGLRLVVVVNIQRGLKLGRLSQIIQVWVMKVSFHKTGKHHNRSILSPPATISTRNQQIQFIKKLLDWMRRNNLFYSWQGRMIPEEEQQEIWENWIRNLQWSKCQVDYLDLLTILDQWKTPATTP